MNYHKHVKVTREIFSSAVELTGAHQSTFETALVAIILWINHIRPKQKTK